MLAGLQIEDVYRPDRRAEAVATFGSDHPEHPGVQTVLGCNPVYLGGKIEGFEIPHHYDFKDMRKTPAQLRAEFARDGWNRVVAFQTRNPMHRAHQELSIRAAKEVGAKLLVHPVVGMTKPGDVDYYTRVRCYRAMMSRYPEGLARLSLLPLAMRMAGPKEAVWHAIIRKNHGATHLVVGRDHAGPGSDSKKKPFYGPYEAQDLLRRHEDEIGVTMVPFEMLVYVKELDAFMPEGDVPKGNTIMSLSGTELRQRLEHRQELPEWFTFPEVAQELRASYPALEQRGITVFFTGLSGSGKSTIANALRDKLLEHGGRQVTMLDGDVVRKHLSSELGFSKEHRDINIRRIGFVAAEIARHGGTAICAAIAPYDAIRKECRAMTQAAGGGFFLVHAATSIEVCEQRDRKGLYAKARAGILKEFTGVSDPYEVPADAEISIDTAGITPDEAAQKIIVDLTAKGYLSA
jgi:sulfate adenylyltransferase